MSMNPEQASQSTQLDGSSREASREASEDVGVVAEENADEMAALGRTTMDRMGEMMRHPAAGATAAGVLVLGAASVFGVIEAALGAGAAYGVYRLQRRRRSDSER
jgi:hypothetical protein